MIAQFKGLFPSNRGQFCIMMILKKGRVVKALTVTYEMNDLYKQEMKLADELFMNLRDTLGRQSV